MGPGTAKGSSRGCQRAAVFHSDGVNTRESCYAGCASNSAAGDCEALNIAGSQNPQKKGGGHLFAPPQQEGDLVRMTFRWASVRRGELMEGGERVGDLIHLSYGK